MDWLKERLLNIQPLASSSARHPLRILNSQAPGLSASVQSGNLSEANPLKHQADVQ
jgi:hypothetical protein